MTAAGRQVAPIDETDGAVHHRRQRGMTARLDQADQRADLGSVPYHEAQHDDRGGRDDQRDQAGPGARVAPAPRRERASRDQHGAGNRPPAEAGREQQHLAHMVGTSQRRR